MGNNVTIGEKVSADELFDRYEEIKNGQYRALHPTWLTDRLPSNAWYDDGKLRVEAPDILSAENSTASLTDLRKEIIKRTHRGHSAREMDEAGVCSESTVSRARRLFKFLLEDPLLYNAYVEDRAFTLSHGQYVLTDEDGQFGVAVINQSEITDEVVEAFHEIVERNPQIRNADGDVVVSSFDVGDEKPIDRYDAVEDIVTIPDEDTDDELSDQEIHGIVAALHRDHQDDLASRVMEELL